MSLSSDNRGAKSLNPEFVNQNCKNLFQFEEDREIISFLSKIKIKNPEADIQSFNQKLFSRYYDQIESINTLMELLVFKLSVEINAGSLSDNTMQVVYNCEIEIDVSEKYLESASPKNYRGQEKIQKVTQYFDIKLLLFTWRSHISLLVIFNDTSQKFRQAQIRQFENYKSKILESISHNLKTPLHCVQMYLDILKQEPGYQEKEEISCISTNLVILNRQINQILDFSMLQKGERLALDCNEFVIGESLKKVK